MASNQNTHYINVNEHGNFLKEIPSNSCQKLVSSNTFNRSKVHKLRQITMLLLAFIFFALPSKAGAGKSKAPN